MVERLLSAKTSDILKMNKEEMKEAIKASEGRIILSENMIIYKPMCDNLTNAEIDCAFGADLILLNFFDFNKPFIAGLNDGDDTNPEYKFSFDCVRKLKKLIGRPVGVNLEPVNLAATMLEERKTISSGRIATKENIVKAQKAGFDFICLTGNPRTGVDNKSILESLSVSRENFDGLIMAGKMHSAGVDEPIIDLKSIKHMVENGADVILVPSVGTIPGFSEAEMKAAIESIHQCNALAMSTIGTSQEGATPTVIEQMAIRNKVCGADIQHIGDVSTKENIFRMSMAIRGQRHTYNRMAQSINR